MSVWKWLRDAAGNGIADTSCPFPEGMAPATVNDSARGLMAAVAQYRDDIAGAIVTAGTNLAYTASSFSGFDTLPHLDKQMVAFTPHTTNGGPATLNYDSLGAKPLRTAPGVELLAGTIILGTPYVAVYNNTDGVFYLQGFYGNPYSVPLLGGMEYWDTVAPNSSFVFPVGQALSRTTYATAFARMGTTYGAGDGTTTFNVPDKRGRVSAMKEDSGSRLTPTYFGGNSTVLGAVGGTDSQTLSVAQLPIVTPAGSVSLTLNNNNNVMLAGGPGSQSGVGQQSAASLVTIGAAASFAGTPFGSGSAHAIVQPTIICNYIMRII